MFTVQNEYLSLAFDEDGGLRRITNLLIPDECLKGGLPGSMPFRVYADPVKEFEISMNDRYQLLFEDPSKTSRAIIQPGNSRLVHCRGKRGLSLEYESEGLLATLQAVPGRNRPSCDLGLTLENRGTETRELMVSFPYLDGVRPGPDPPRNLATAMDQAGVVVPAWARPGGVLGEGNQMSMQWHTIWDPLTRSALGIIIMDPDVRPKRLILKEPSIEINYFPPFSLGPGQSLSLPRVRILAYKGDWRRAARAYRRWFGRAFACAEPPTWFRRSDGCTGRHFKKGGPGIEPDYPGQFALESFRELPLVHLKVPVDITEYAFFSRGSMLHGVHTDGDNVVREDMGGAQAMREGIAAVHRLGLHVMLYVEGYIVHGESDLAKSGRVQRWAVMHRDGSIDGPYTRQGFLHMCPGCNEWQDHLAQTVSRLLRETGADGVRLDSLGFYYLPCYNPAHSHETPFGYNGWIKQLLAKVRKAALEVNPDALLTTEGPADWYSQWFHGALTARCPRELPLMRLAAGPYRPYAYSATGAVWGSISGFAGGGCSGPELAQLDANWLCARFPVHEALVWGDVCDDPMTSDPHVVARLFRGKGYWALVAVRPECKDPFLWPPGTGLSREHPRYTITITGLTTGPEDAVVCNIETLEWSAVDLEARDGGVTLSLDANWALVILRERGGPGVAGMGALPALRPSQSAEIEVLALASGARRQTCGRVSVTAPGLEVRPARTTMPGHATITVPSNAPPGNYAVMLRGKGILGAKRFLVVR